MNRAREKNVLQVDAPGVSSKTLGPNPLDEPGPRNSRPVPGTKLLPVSINHVKTLVIDEQTSIRVILFGPRKSVRLLLGNSRSVKGSFGK